MERGVSMKALGFGVLLVGFGLSVGCVWAQMTNGQAAPASARKTTMHHHRHRHRATRQADQVIPRESQGASAPSPDETAAQRAADQRLLKQQQAQSAQAAAVTNQVVEQAEKQQQQMQKEVRIQDAPGPAQTGVVPAAGPPVAPVNADDRIQDAPGPAQTLPALPATTQPVSTQPASTQPAQAPASTPQ
jgi:hypothetical protein